MTVLDDHMAEILLSPAEVLAAVSDIDRRSALLALAVRRLETSGEYATGGAVSINAWLREHARMTNQRAGELVSTGRFFDTYPSFAQAAVSGVLSGSQIDIARRLNRHKYAAALAAHQGELVELLAATDITVTAKLVDHWRKCADAVTNDNDDAPPLEPVCELMFGRTLDNELHGTLNLHDAAATEFEKAINNAITHHGDDETRSLAERQGDALYDIAAFFNKNHTGDGTPATCRRCRCRPTSPP